MSDTVPRSGREAYHRSDTGVPLAHSHNEECLVVVIAYADCRARALEVTLSSTITMRDEVCPRACPCRSITKPKRQ